MIYISPIPLPRARAQFSLPVTLYIEFAVSAAFDCLAGCEIKSRLHDVKVAERC